MYKMLKYCTIKLKTP